MSGGSAKAAPKGRGLGCPTPTKTAYTNRKDAKRVRKLIQRKVADPVGLRVYLCACGAFHIGHGDAEHRNMAQPWQLPEDR